MQLLSLTLYSRDGRQRTVPFRPGELNIVTGEPRTGKSALLTIVEYCLGRDSMLVPIGPITDTVGWYAALWQLDGNARAFIARPAPRPGRASTQLAMLEFGGADLEPLAYDRLEANTDSRAVREQLGRRIGIEENLAEPAPGSLRQPLEANLGHATLLCLQGQSEIANANQLFHRQGEPGIDQALRDTIPYFLGAVARDQALKRAQLRDARRTLQRIETTLRTTQEATSILDVQLLALLTEARTVGLTDAANLTDRTELVATLQAARHAPQPEAPRLPDPREQDRRRDLEHTRDDLRAELSRLMDDRALLLDQSDGEGGYRQAVALQAGRLTSLDLLGPNLTSTAQPPTDQAESAPNAEDDDQSNASDTCPACGQQMDDPTPTADQLRTSLIRLNEQLTDLDAVRPRQRAALQELDTAIASVRERLSAAEAALDSLLAATAVTAPTTGGGRDFVRGRIDAVLARIPAIDDLELRRLQTTRNAAAATVLALEAELDDGDEREQLTSRLLAVSRNMTDYAEELQLEHRGPNVRLDLARLTVVTDVETGPAPLFRIGSAENHIGYHLVSHLGLHRYFTRQNRPVPRFLMLDQPTQAYYPSEITQRTGVAATDTDREAVLRIFLLMQRVATELAPNFQVIVCDHANLSEEWFQKAVTHNWRDGEALIPQDSACRLTPWSLELAVGFDLVRRVVVTWGGHRLIIFGFLPESSKTRRWPCAAVCRTSGWTASRPAGRAALIWRRFGRGSMTACPSGRMRCLS